MEPSTKVCSLCGETFSPTRKQGRRCQPCRNAWQREKRRQTGNAYTKKYEKTPKGFLMRLYRNMKSRITGVQDAGKTLLSKEEFYEWAINHPDFIDLFAQWSISAWDISLTPSVDRLDSGRGYEHGNMEWVTHSENSRRGGLA